MTKCLGTTAEIKINTNIYILYANSPESPHILRVRISNLTKYSPEEMLIMLLHVSPEIRKTNTVDANKVCTLTKWLSRKQQ